MPGDSGILTDRHVNVDKSLDSMALAAEFFVDPVEPLGALFGPFSLGSLQLLYRLVMSFTFFINTRAPPHREQVVAATEGESIHGGAPQEHRDGSHDDYLTTSEGISPFNKHVLGHHSCGEVQDDHPSITRCQVKSGHGPFKDYLIDLGVT